jgi:hypothetical protein
MPEIGTSGLMSGDGKRGDGQRPQATAPILDSTIATLADLLERVPSGTCIHRKAPPIHCAHPNDLDADQGVSYGTILHALQMPVA